MMESCTHRVYRRRRLGVTARLMVMVVVPIAGSSARADDPRDFLEISVGTLPIIITSPHGGGMIPSDVSPRVCDVDGEVCLNDQNTHLISAALGDELELLTGARPYQIINRIDRLYIDQNRSNSANPNGANESYEDGDARPYYEFYHGAVRESLDRVLLDHGRGLLIDVHGQSSYPNTVIRGTRNGQTVTQLLELHGEEALTGPNSVFGQLETLGYPVTPPNVPLSEERETIYNGGYTVATYGSHRTTGIDSIQIEFSREFRTTPGNPDIWQQSARDLAKAIEVFYNTYLIEPTITGDYNNDGFVNLADYTVWRNNLGAADEAVINDGGDGLAGVDLGDYEVWKQHFGAAIGSVESSHGAQVPEPSAVLLLLFTLAGVVPYRPRSA